MLDEQSKTMLGQVWDALPRPLKDVVLSDKIEKEVGRAMAGIALDADGLSSLQLEVLYVILGMQTVEEFESQLTHHPKITAEQGRQFAKHVYENVFAELRSYLPPSASDGDRQENVLASIAAAIETYGLVRERLERLPQNVQTIIQSPVLEDALRKLVTKYQLSPEHATAFVAEATRVMVGLTTTNNFKMEVTRVTALDPNTLDALFLDTEVSLFKPVRLAIMQALEQRQGATPQQQTPATPPQKPSPTPQAVDPYREPIR